MRSRTIYTTTNTFARKHIQVGMIHWNNQNTNVSPIVNIRWLDDVERQRKAESEWGNLYVYVGGVGGGGGSDDDDDCCVAVIRLRTL